MGTERQEIARRLRRLRTSRGQSWAALAGELAAQARRLRFARIASTQPSSIRRTIARWEAGTSIPDERYQVLLAYAYARTPLGPVSLGPGSDFAELLETFALMGVDRQRRNDIVASVTSSVTRTGRTLLAFLGPELRADLASAMDEPGSVDLQVIDGLNAATDTVNRQVGSVPFVRLHLAQAGITEACRHLLLGEQPPPVRTALRRTAATAYALAARLAFETHDDDASLALYSEAAQTSDPAQPAYRALIRTSQTMVAYYVSGDIGRARHIADRAVADARAGNSNLMRARAHALQAEMAARSGPSQHRDAHMALHLARHDLDSADSDDPMSGAFSSARLNGFEGICQIFLGEARRAEQHLAEAVATLNRPRERVQRAIVLTDLALAQIRTGEPGSAEAAVGQLHECVDLTAATRGRVAAQRLRHARVELRPWRTEPFVAELDDHIHSDLIGI